MVMRGSTGTRSVADGSGATVIGAGLRAGVWTAVCAAAIEAPAAARSGEQAFSRVG